MYYSVKELRDKLIERVIGLGVDKSFLENPAFASAISQIDNLIGQMNMFEAAEAVTVKEENGNISFDWTSPVGDKYSMSATPGLSIPIHGFPKEKYDRRAEK